jgi:large subunit ribosomal protein L13
MKTFTPKKSDVVRQWHLIDATDVVLGKLAVVTADLLRGKRKPTFAPHVDSGDFVVITNVQKIALSGNKLENKKLYKHSGYMGGLSEKSYKELLKTNPERIVEHAVKGMLPGNRLVKGQIARLKIYKGDAHNHGAQNPKAYALERGK